MSAGDGDRHGREGATIERVHARVPVRETPPLLALSKRIAVAFGLLVVIAVTAYLTRDGYADDTGQPLTWLSAFYYASVSITTTGYGDITPVSDVARFTTALVVTPARVGFLLLVVGTTVELLTDRWREAARRDRWRRRVRDHYVICGYGVKGRSAARALLEDGVGPGDVVVVERSRQAAEEANRDGFTAVTGDATSTRTLLEAQVERAAVVIIAPERDDTAVLMTLTARELAPEATIVASVRERENAHLLQQGGADAVITSSETSGLLLGLTSRRPRTAAVVTDLLHTSYGLSLEERQVDDDEVGRPLSAARGMNIAIVRDGTLLRYDNPASRSLEAGDVLVGLPEPPATDDEDAPHAKVSNARTSPAD